MVDDDTDNRKELEMPKTQLFVRLSGTHMLRYGDFQRLFLCLEAAKPLNRALKRFCKILKDRQTDLTPPPHTRRGVITSVASLITWNWSNGSCFLKKSLIIAKHFVYGGL